jgi:ribosomal protein S18 acetylase RimI-like enzyme
MESASSIAAEVQIRRAEAEDVHGITSCVLSAYAPWVERIGMKPGPTLANYNQVLATAHVVIAELGLEVVGVLVMTITSEGFLLENVAVRPQFAGRGIGKRLLQFAEREALSNGYRSIYLYTHERMVANIAWYRRLGYLEYARRVEGPFARVFMRKALPFKSAE